MSGSMIGVGITTRNRHEVLRVGLRHFSNFHEGNIRYVVVDDNSDEPYDAIVNEFAADIDVALRRSPRRLGVAAAKNACLAALSECDDVFLFDDDAWPRSANWASRWLSVAAEHQVGHSMYVNYLNENDTLYRIKDTQGSGEMAMNWWNNCMGLALHFSRDCLNSIGGYDIVNAKNVYGYEHAQMSQRAKRAGFAGSGKASYASPAIVDELVYSMDVTCYFHGAPSPCGLPVACPRTVTPEEIAGAEQNSQLMRLQATFIELIDPLVSDDMVQT
jgi:glycosyltransferase involved in cell wall biosynthesis